METEEKDLKKSIDPVIAMQAISTVATVVGAGAAIYSACKDSKKDEK